MIAKQFLDLVDRLDQLDMLNQFFDHFNRNFSYRSCRNALLTGDLRGFENVRDKRKLSLFNIGISVNDPFKPYLCSCIPS